MIKERLENLLYGSEDKIYFGSILETIIIFMLGIAQICYLKQILETKTVI